MVLKIDLKFSKYDHVHYDMGTQYIKLQQKILKREKVDTVNYRQ